MITMSAYLHFFERKVGSYARKNNTNQPNAGEISSITKPKNCLPFLDLTAVEVL